MTRRSTTFVLVLVFSAALVLPILAAGPSGCASCSGAARCCCAPAKGEAGCRLARTCGARDDGVQTPQDAVKGIVEPSVRGRVPQAQAVPVGAETCDGPADLPSTPPDPPPRSSL